jgi:excisionase family DNA binding protein
MTVHNGGGASERLLMSIGEAAAALAIGRTTLYELMWSGEIRPVRIGRSVRFAKSELTRFIDSHTDYANPPNV